MKKLLVIALVMFSAAAARAQVAPKTTLEQITTGTITIGEDGLTGLSSSECSETLVSTELIAGRLEIVRRSTCYPISTPAVVCTPGPCDWSVRRVWREVYAARDGRIVLIKKIEGKITPAQTERIEWPEDLPPGASYCCFSEECHRARFEALSKLAASSLAELTKKGPTK